MPEVHVDVRWPDGHQQWLHSPSTVVEDVFTAGASYPLVEFVRLGRAAMTEASARVEARYGFPCSRAAATLQAIERTAAGCPDGPVTVAGFRRP